MLAWSPLFDLDEGFGRTIAWYRKLLAVSEFAEAVI
jgi:nucleoside-diphosphate-sugar epimerase